MKMRIRGNSIRLRVTQPELAQLAATGRVEDSIRFAPGEEAGITYALLSGGVAIAGSFSGNRIEIRLPAGFVQSWAASDTVGTQAKIDIGDGEFLFILVEKDFICLTPQPEDQSRAFPNPSKTCQ